MTADTPAQRRARRRGRSGRAHDRAMHFGRRLVGVDQVALAAAVDQRAGAGPATADRNVRRWVPIGPSVILTFHENDFRRTTGRVRDVKVSPDGTRAYAATAKGGVWYTSDAGASWRPLDDRRDVASSPMPTPSGGYVSSQACGCLLVEFHEDDVGQDFVMVGTGEPMPFTGPRSMPAADGIGVLAGRGVVGHGWEKATGHDDVGGTSIFRLARHPYAVPGATAPVARSGPTGRYLADQVLAATTKGLFLGRRGAIGADPPAFAWVELDQLSHLPGLNQLVAPIVTDVAWVATGPDTTRIVVAIARALGSAAVRAQAGGGIAYSDDGGATFRWLDGLSGIDATVRAVGRMSIAVTETSGVAHARRLYVLGEAVAGGKKVACVWQVPDVTAAPPAARRLGDVPPVWVPRDPGQRDYDQAIAVTVSPAGDRLYLGGDVYVVQPDPIEPDTISSLWCFDVAGDRLVGAFGSATSGSVPGGLIGAGVHADIHAITVMAGGHVWVACDGGVFASTEAGRRHTFAPRGTGLAAVETNFVAAHATSSHYVALGCQDNGRPLRIGDVVWEDTAGGDGGGVTFHASLNHVVVSQFNTDDWKCEPWDSGFVQPTRRTPRSDMARERALSAIYSGAASMKYNGGARIALGTNRVWVTDDLGTAQENTWFVLPYPEGRPRDPRSGGGDPRGDWRVGVPALGRPGLYAHWLPDANPVGRGKLGPVETVKWVSPEVLLALFSYGVVRWTQKPNRDWSADLLAASDPLYLERPVPGSPNASTNPIIDLAPVPDGSGNFYLATEGNPKDPTTDTCFFFHSATWTFHPTGLRRALDPSDQAGAGPRDPALSVVVDPADTTRVFVGTVTGVWQSRRDPGTHQHGQWTLLDNGLPRAIVQDLNIWHDPAAGPNAVRLLLRAALQSRGVWELDLAARTEPQRTYARAHAFDDRRRLPTPLADPQRPAGPGNSLRNDGSPDIIVRPRWVGPLPPKWPLARGSVMDAGWTSPFDLLMFQTAFRWIYPAVVADGQWSPALGDFVARYRAGLGPLGSSEPRITEAVWDAVVGTRLDRDGRVSATGELAITRPPWQTPASMDATATEIDLVEYIRNLRNAGADTDKVLPAFPEPSAVDVLVHHRDTIPVPAGGAFCVLLWRKARTADQVLDVDVGGIEAYVRSVLDYEANGGTLPDPSGLGWHVVEPAAPPPPLRRPLLHRLGAEVEARMPRAVSIDVDLTGLKPPTFVLFLAIVGSSIDPCTVSPVGLPSNPRPGDLARAWPYAALRLVEIVTRAEVRPKPRTP